MDRDDSTRAGVVVAFAAVGLVVLGVIGAVVMKQLHLKSSSATPAAAAASAPASAPTSAADRLLDELLDMPLAGDIVGKVYFASGESGLPTDAQAALDQAVAALKAAGDNKRLVLSGFHDASGDPAKNAELAKQRALAVRQALVSKGVDPQRIGLRKPEQMVGGDRPEEARRVELRLVTTH